MSSDYGLKVMSGNLSLSVILLALAATTLSILNETRQASASCGDLEHPSGIFQSLSLPSDEPDGVVTQELTEGVVYELIVAGEFSYNLHGETIDGRTLLVNGSRPPLGQAGDHVYCVEVLGQGAALALTLNDSHFDDNEGALDVLLIQKTASSGAR